MDRVFEKNISSLEKIFAFTEEFAHADSVQPSLIFSIKFVLEELFTNMIKYNPDGGKEVEISLAVRDKGVEIGMVDYSNTPFDLRDAGDVDVNTPMEERKEGGLGIHLVRKLVDKIDYTFDGGRNKITLIKYLEK